MSEDRPSVLVTGANGFVGSRLCLWLNREGYRVIAGVRKTSDLKLLKDVDVEYRYGDIAQPDTLPDMVAGCDFVVHNAGVTKVGRRETFFTVNEQGTKSLCEAVAKHNPSVKRLVYISSLAAMGPSYVKPLTEDDEPHPITTYGRSKLAGEKAALAFADRYEVVALRPSGVYGPGDTEMFTFFQSIHRGIRPLLGDTSRKLQLVHVDDVCRAILCALRAEGESGKAYLIAEGRAYTFSEAVDILARALGKRGIPICLPGPVFRTAAAISEGVAKLFGRTPMVNCEKAAELLASWEVSTARAASELGFSAEISWEDGARATYEWYLKEGWLK